MERAIVDLPLATLELLGYAPLLREVELFSMYLLRWEPKYSIQIIRCRPRRTGVTVEGLLRSPLVLGGRLLRTEGDTWVVLATLRATPLLRSLNQPFGEVYPDPLIEVRKGRFRFSVLGESERLREAIGAARRVGLEFEVIRFERADPGPRNPMSALTPRQQQVLRAAVEMGYFENPKRVRLHDLGKLLGQDKSTVSETLRRAQKHLLETVLGMTA